MSIYMIVSTKLYIEVISCVLRCCALSAISLGQVSHLIVQKIEIIIYQKLSS